MLTKFNHYDVSIYFTLGLIISGLPIFVVASVSAPTESILLYTAGSHDGNLGGREGADTFCATQTPSGYTQVRAFLSVDGTDEIRDMPTNYQISTTAPILGSADTLIANNWQDLLDGSITDSLSTAIADLGVAGWWSGSYTDGSLRNENCSQWSSNSNNQTGSLGTSISTNSSWINSGVASTCTQSSYTVLSITLKLNVLCVAYNPVNPAPPTEEESPPPTFEPPTDSTPSTDLVLLPADLLPASDLPRPATIPSPPSTPSTPAIVLSPNVLNGIAEIKVFRDGKEIASSADANLLEQLLHHDYETDSSLKCGTIYHYETQITMVTGKVTTIPKLVITPACPIVPVYVPSEYALFLKAEGTGGGTVRSNLGGLFCQTTNCQPTANSQGHYENDCDPDYCKVVLETHTQVQLTPQADPGSVFTSWGGHPDCVDGELVITGGRFCTAFFQKIHKLSVTTVGQGTIQGTIRSYDLSQQPLNIDCRTGTTSTNKCRAFFSFGTSLVLKAIPENGANFKGWSGDCQSKGSQAEIVIKMKRDKNCIAQFE